VDGDTRALDTRVATTYIGRPYEYR
jgi:hypothetical protein